MSSRTGPRVLTTFGAIGMVVAAVGFILTLILNAFVFDQYDAYGEIPIPGSGSVHLPAGDVTVTFHTLLVGSTSGSGLPVPPLTYRIDPPEGADEPQLTEDYGSTTTVNNDARVRIGYLHVPVDGDYRFRTDGNVGPYLSPRLAFGHGSNHGLLPTVFSVAFGVGVVDLLLARLWASRIGRRAAVVGSSVPTADFGAVPTWTAGDVAPTPVQASYPSSGEGIRIEQLNMLARLRDSGALTQAEYVAEKKRVLDGL